MVPLTSSDVSQTQGHGPSSRLNRRATASAVTLGVAAIALLAFVSTLAHAAGNPSRMVLEQHACGVVMGLRQPGDLYDTCIRSLEKTLSELDQSRLIAAERRSCAQEGLRRRTPAFAKCVLNTEQSPAAVGGPSPSVEPNTSRLIDPKIGDSNVTYHLDRLLCRSARHGWRPERQCP